MLLVPGIGLLYYDQACRRLAGAHPRDLGRSRRREKRTSRNSPLPPSFLCQCLSRIMDAVDDFWPLIPLDVVVVVTEQMNMEREQEKKQGAVLCCSRRVVSKRANRADRPTHNAARLPSRQLLLSCRCSSPPFSSFLALLLRMPRPGRRAPTPASLQTRRARRAAPMPLRIAPRRLST